MQIAGFEVVGELGRGGAGVVYRAYPLRGGAPVALKVFEGATPKRFAREAEALASLQHPSVARYAGSGHERGLGAWLALELVEGESMQSQLDRRGAFPIKEAVRLVTELAAGLAHAHARGIVHRDVKPDNVILRDDGTPVLVDFGLALDLEAEHTRLTQQGAFLGTPGYWAPEQARGELDQVGPPADVYGLGATLYTLLKGEPPVQAGSLVAYLASAAFKAIPPLQLEGALGAEVSALCSACLRQEPQRRPPSDELARSLVKLRASYSSESGEQPTLGRRKRGVALAALAGAVLVLVLGVSVAMLIPRGPSGPLPLEVALAAQARGEWAAVVDACSERLLQAPDDLAALKLRAQAHAELSEHDAAIADLNRALELAPDDPGGLLLRAESRFELDAWALAQADAERALALGGDPARSRLVAGMAAHWQFKDQEVVELLGPCKELIPDNKLVWGYRGVSLRRLERFEQAAEELSEALRLDPDYAVARLARGVAREHLGDVDGALSDYTEAFERDRSDPQGARMERLRLNMNLRRYQAALADLEPLIAEDPEDAWLWRSLAIARSSLGDHAGGYEASKRGLQIDQSVGSAWWNHGHLCRHLERRSEALEAFLRVLELNPDEARALGQVGELYLHSGRVELALDALNRGIELEPNQATLLNLRGEAMGVLGDLAAAVRDTSRAIELNPGVARFHNARAVSLLAQGELERALSDYAAAARLNPRGYMGWRGQASVKLLQGDVEEAARLAKLAQERTANQHEQFETVFLLAEIAWTRGDDEAALRLTTRLLQVTPREPRVLYLRAKTFARSGRFAEAVELGEQAADNLGPGGDLDSVEASLTTWRAELGR